MDNNYDKKSDRLLQIIILSVVGTVLIFCVAYFFVNKQFNKTASINNNTNLEETSSTSSTTEIASETTIISVETTNATAETTEAITTSKPDNNNNNNNNNNQQQTNKPSDNLKDYPTITDSQSNNSFSATLEGIYNTCPNVLPYNNTMTQEEKNNYLKKIVFLGDSTTYGLRYYGILPGGTSTYQVWTPLSGTLTLSDVSYAKIYYPDNGTEMTIASAVALKKPEIMVITLGVNGISFMSEESFKHCYGGLISSIKSASPKTNIILQTIFPVCKSYAYQGSINNERIAKADVWISELATSYGVYFANTALALVGNDGYLPESLQNGDGLHLNASGYNIEIGYIVNHPIPSFVPERPVETTAKPADTTAAPKPVETTDKPKPVETTAKPKPVTTTAQETTTAETTGPAETTGAAETTGPAETINPV